MYWFMIINILAVFFMNRGYMIVLFINVNYWDKLMMFNRVDKY